MQPQRKAASFVRQQVPAATLTRREVRSNVIEWRQQARAKSRQRVSYPGEDGTPEIIPARRQNLWLAAFAIITLLVVGARLGGLL